MKSLLLILLCFIAFTSVVSGIMMISGPDGKIMNLPLSLLKGTPFRNFLVPGILLTFIVGGINLLAAYYNLLKRTNQYNWAIAGGLVISAWIIVQMILIRAAHWLHFLYLGTGIFIVLLAYQLKGKWAA